jgi:hypothetical protein
MKMAIAPPLLALSLALALVGAGCVVEHRVPHHARPVAVEHGRVVAAELLQRPSAAQQGAVVGGLLGFFLSGRSAPEKIFGTFWGAAAGSAIAEANEGPRQAWGYTVQFRDGRMQRVLTERPDLRPGDCVAVESARYVNLRRVSDAFCAPASAGAPPAAPLPPAPPRPPAASEPPAASQLPAVAPPDVEPQPDAAIEDKVQADAARCEEAKDELARSKSREETEVAVRKVRVFCDM